MKNECVVKPEIKFMLPLLFLIYFILTIFFSFLAVYWYFTSERSIFDFISIVFFLYGLLGVFFYFWYLLESPKAWIIKADGIVCKKYDKILFYCNWNEIEKIKVLSSGLVLVQRKGFSKEQSLTFIDAESYAKYIPCEKIDRSPF